MVHVLLRTFDDTPAVGCKDWRWQSLNRPSRHAVRRGCEELMTLEKDRLSGDNSLGYDELQRVQMWV